MRRRCRRGCRGSSSANSASTCPAGSGRSSVRPSSPAGRDRTGAARISPPRRRWRHDVARCGHGGRGERSRVPVRPPGHRRTDRPRARRRVRRRSALPQLRTGLGRSASAISRRPVELPDAPVVVRLHPPARSGVGHVRSDEHLRVGRARGRSIDAGLAVDLVFASALSWIVGFVVIGVPGGIGVRETVFVGLMTGPLGATLALSVAVTSRLVTVAVDLTGRDRRGDAQPASPDRWRRRRYDHRSMSRPTEADDPDSRASTRKRPCR